MPASPFEFVRLAVLPSIRPPGVDQAASMDLPEEGVASISGTGGGVIDLAFSVTHSWNRQIHEEEKRKFDKMRVYATRSGGGGAARSARAGGIDRNFYVEIEVVREIRFENGQREGYAKAPTSESVELISEGHSRSA